MATTRLEPGKCLKGIGYFREICDADRLEGNSGTTGGAIHGIWRLFPFLLASAAAPPARAQNWTVYNNVKYSFADPETADFHVLDRGVDPVVVFIHGGGWQAGNKSAYAG